MPSSNPTPPNSKPLPRMGGAIVLGLTNGPVAGQVAVLLCRGTSDPIASNEAPDPARTCRLPMPFTPDERIRTHCACATKASKAWVLLPPVGADLLVGVLIRSGRS